MSNKPHRRPRGVVVGVDAVSGAPIIAPAAMFPTSTPRLSLFERLAREALIRRIKDDPHDVALVDLGHDTYEVNCSCGFVAPAPFGEEHATRIKQNHLYRMGRGLDPLGAKYR